MQKRLEEAKTNRHITVFQYRVYLCLLAIPKGKVATYAQVTKAVGCGSARAVGQALRTNPFAPDVPCHRVIRSDGSLGGFCGSSGQTALHRKLDLLQKEGVLFYPRKNTLGGPQQYVTRKEHILATLRLAQVSAA